MKICFVNPKGVHTNDPALSKMLHNDLPRMSYRYSFSGMGLALLVIASLTPEDYEIELVDENFDKINFDIQYDLIALTANTEQAERAYEISKEFRRKSIKTLIGGIHATVMPQEAKQHVDYVIKGEGEYAWIEFLNDFKNGKARNEYSSTKLVDIKKLPIPKYDLLKPENYRVIWVQTTRGCPHDCEFCVASSIYGKKYRNKEIKQIIDEIKYIKSIWKNPQISFADDNMFVNRKYSKELLKELKKLNIRYWAQTDISVGEDDELLRLLKESGCGMLFIGFESVSYDTLQKIDKNQWKVKYLKKYAPLISKIQSLGIGIYGAFIIGNDQDSKATCEKLMDFICDNHLYATQVTILTPYPGSRLRDRLEQENRLLKKSWGHYSCMEVNFKPINFTINELQNMLTTTYKRIYDKKQLTETAKYFINIFKGNN